MDIGGDKDLMEKCDLCFGIINTMGLENDKWNYKKKEEQVMLGKKQAAQVNHDKHNHIQAEQEQIRKRLKQVRHQILVLSGKGGVGKSTVAVNLAMSLALAGKHVGLLAIEIHGPSVPKLLGIENAKISQKNNKIEPVLYEKTLKVMSIGFLLATQNDALVWRGPMKHNVIKQFISDVAWDRLDYLVVDCPPGTGDEALSTVQLLGENTGAIIVTTPQQIAVIDVKKCITFCRQMKLPVLGIIENMSGFLCPHCNQKTNLFTGNGGKRMAGEFNVPLLANIPMDPAFIKACDCGEPFINAGIKNHTLQAFRNAFEYLLKLNGNQQTGKS